MDPESGNPGSVVADPIMAERRRIYGNANAVNRWHAAILHEEEEAVWARHGGGD